MWEMKVVPVFPDKDLGMIREILDDCGNEGWELVAVSALHNTHYAWLKRRKAPNLPS